jgi:hypothetical protein
VKEYDVFVPLNYNDGRRVEGEKLQRLQEELLNRFQGLTFFPQPNTGFWKMGDVTYRDEIVIYRVIASADEDARPWSCITSRTDCQSVHQIPLLKPEI